MRLQINFFALGCALWALHVQGAENPCPTDTEYACFDVINSSLCLSQNAAAGTKEQMAACVEYDNGMSDLPGASKVGLRL